MRVESKPDFFSVEVPGRSAPAYNESAFRYFLSVERNRSERSGQSFGLVLVDQKTRPGGSRRLDTEIAAKLFSGLSLCLRETDFIGWYQESAVAGAVLTHLGDNSGTEFST